MRSMAAKGHYKYYFCRKKDCYYKRAVPEKKVEELFLAELKRIAFTKEEGEMFVKAAKKIRGDIFPDFIPSVQTNS